MATKPVSAYTHATDTNFGSGPASGNPTKLAVVDAAQGFIPGEGIAAEPVNWLFNATSLWLAWVQGGSATADVDAHLVETSLAGRIAVQGGTIGDVTGDFQVLLVQNASPSDNTTLVNTGAGVGLRVTSGGIGAIVTGGSSNLGIQTTGGSSGGTGIKATGVGSGVGGTFFGGALGEAAVCTGERDSLQPILKLDRQGSGTITRGSVHAFEQATPTIPQQGDWWCDTEKPGLNVSAFSFAHGSDALRAWGTEEGYFYQHAEVRGGTTTDSVDFADGLAVSLTVDPAPGLYMVFFSCSGQSNHGSDPPIRIEFDTGVVGKSADYEVSSDVGTNRSQPFSAIWQINITASTDLTIRVATGVGGQEVECLEAEITIQGAHDLKAGPP